jgi:protein TonB
MVTDIGDGHAASRGAESRRLWLLIAALVVITAAAGGWYLFGRGGSASEPPEREARTAPVVTETPGPEAGAALLTEEELIEQAREVAAAEIEKQEEALRQRLEEEFPTPTPFPPTPTPTVTATAAPTVTSTATRVPPTATRVPPTVTPVRATPTPAVREGDIVSIGPGVTPPVPIQQATPEYPRMALRLRQTGIVEAEALVGIDGAIEEFRLITVDRPGIGFEAATEAAVRTWRYKPATKFGVKVRMWVTVRVPFKAE